MIRTQPAESVTVTIDGRRIKVSAGVSVAAALMEAGIAVFRHSPVTGAPRAPFCMMGVCFDCLVTIDGLENQQACQLVVRDGMVIERHPGDPHHHTDDGGHP
jgi:predicted molibdopterin-dependent oxidoreductase YjgC